MLDGQRMRKRRRKRERAGVVKGGGETEVVEEREHLISNCSHSPSSDVASYTCEGTNGRAGDYQSQRANENREREREGGGGGEKERERDH